MWVKCFLGLFAVVTVTAIRVPVNEVSEEKDGASALIPSEEGPSEPKYYTPDDIKLETYLLPPETQRYQEVILDVLASPASYLLPPAIGKQSDYHYEGTSTGQQSDWYPVTQISQTSDVEPIILPELNETEAIKILEYMRNGKVLHNDRFSLPTPSTALQPPAPDAPNDYIVLNTSEELELPANNNPRLKIRQNVDKRRPIYYNVDQSRFNPNLQSIYKQKLIKEAPTQIMNFHKSMPPQYKKPTKLYPKKYVEGFKPIPIPVSQFADEISDEIPRARPLQPFHPILSVKGENQLTSDENKAYYEQYKKKHVIQYDNSAEKQHILTENPDDDTKSSTEEQQTSASHLRNPERNVYHAPLRQEPQRPVEYAPPPAGERTEFRMHGMKGPHSYQFGFDTGKGKNRQFRYEERDNDGHVRGHYGYMDRNGKLRVVNYDADPEHGFRAETPVEKDQ
ncbi:unnamed protein product [Parnassius apollo]|uniref:(apollo) hypothetical protein n=1 Tax=Parnassius apollo TaxID=110799 RepID=A0A8S3XTC4_PARAO|nr:unnamed protein product [Parnassius apollo]